MSKSEFSPEDEAVASALTDLFQMRDKAPNEYEEYMTTAKANGVNISNLGEVAKYMVEANNFVATQNLAFIEKGKSGEEMASRVRTVIEISKPRRSQLQ